jgi:hypothetical protein
MIGETTLRLRCGALSEGGPPVSWFQKGDEDDVESLPEPSSQKGNARCMLNCEESI